MCTCCAAPGTPFFRLPLTLPASPSPTHPALPGTTATVAHHLSRTLCARPATWVGRALAALDPAGPWGVVADSLTTLQRRGAGRLLTYQRAAALEVRYRAFAGRSAQVTRGALAPGLNQCNRYCRLRWAALTQGTMPSPLAGTKL